MWIAAARQNLGTRWVNPGDPVPEAEHWPDREPWITHGFIRWVAGDYPKAEDPIEQPMTVIAEAPVIEEMPTAITIIADPDPEPEPETPAKKSSPLIRRRKKRAWPA